MDAICFNEIGDCEQLQNGRKGMRLEQSDRLRLLNLVYVRCCERLPLCTCTLAHAERCACDSRRLCVLCAAPTDNIGEDTYPCACGELALSVPSGTI